jgi:hypothetical protein
MAKNEQERILDDVLRSLPLLPLQYFLSLFFHLFSFPFLAFLEITCFSFFLLISIELNDKFKSKSVLSHLGETGAIWDRGWMGHRGFQHVPL